MPQRGYGASRALVLAAAFAMLSGCEASDTAATPTREPAAWRADCPSPSRTLPLGMDTAREAHRFAELRHEVRMLEAATPGTLLRRARAWLDPAALEAGEYCPQDVAEVGQLLFEHEYGYDDGLGGGEAAKGTSGPFRRIHDGLFGGPETISCPSCHWVGGPNGAGAETDNAILAGNGQLMGSGDARNPQALIGLGVVQALAREMTSEFHAQRDGLVRDAGKDGGVREVRLASKGVDFGVLRVGEGGALDFTGVRGIDADLVVKPFGWKGTLPRFEEFAAEALQVHMGVQSAMLLKSGSPDTFGKGEDPLDRDGDGRKDEFEQGPLVALGLHLALLEIPIVRPLIQDRFMEPAAQALLPPTTTSFAYDFQRGREVFHQIGCATCHQPMMLLKNPVLELDGAPPIDLVRYIRSTELRFDAELGGYPVWLFSDLKRHDMGEANMARHTQRGVGREWYLTPRLWGVADSAPYLHDGRAPSFDYAIAGHDGEGADARAKFKALDFHAKGALRVYLMSLRRESRLTVLQ